MIGFFKLNKLFSRSVRAIRTRVKRIKHFAIRLDSSIRPSKLRALREESIKLYSQNSLARALLEILCTNVIGSGLRLSLSLNDLEGVVNPDELEKKIMERWEIWSRTKRSDYSQITNFQDLQQQAFLSKLLQGEVFSIQRFEDSMFTVQLIEAHRTAFIGSVGGFADTEKEQGIKYDLKGRELQFIFDDVYKIDAKTADGRKQVIHYFRQERPGQMRGIPYLTPTMDDFKNLKQYKEYEIKAMIISASFTAFVKSDKNDPLGTGPLAEEALNQDPRYDSEKDYAIKPGAIFALDPGEDIVAMNPARPATSFSVFYDTVVRDLAAAMGVPFNVLVKKFDTAYTAARAAVLEFWKVVMVERNHFALGFNQEIFEQWLWFEVLLNKISIPNYIADDDLRDRVNNSTMWIGNAMPQMDEGKAVMAANKRVAGGLSTREIETKNRDNGDFFQNAEKLKREEEALGITAEENRETTAINR